MPETKDQQTTTNRKCKWRPNSKVCLIGSLCLVAIGTTLFGIIRYDKELLRILNIRQSILKTTYILDGLNNSESINESLYTVYNPSCQIPNYPPFHDDIKPHFKRMKPVKCTSQPLLTSIVYQKSRNTLKLHKKYFRRYDSGPVNKTVCCYSIIILYTNQFEFRDCEVFNRSIILPSWTQAVYTQCEVRGSVFYRNHHFMVSDDNARRKLELFDKKNQSVDAMMSVMIVGIDSVSKLNLARSMPETHAYLESNAWYALQGYHKVNSNTFYNLGGPVMTGHSAEQLMKICWPNEHSEQLDYCPWIWKNFSNNGYITAYGEDAGRADTFSFNGVFKYSPTEYYMRPFILAAKSNFFNLFLNYTSFRYYPACIGPMNAAESVLDFSADFASRFVNRPTFSLFWMNSFSHEELNAPSTMDHRVLTYFSSLERSGVFNRSMIVFMSDHGFQRGQFRETYMGSLEDSLPFLYIWLPEWFKKKHPVKVQNLSKNKNRLTSHFDLHLTLTDVLGLKTTAAGCPKCVSLFDQVPWNRSCSDAGIAEDSCACARYDQVPTDSDLVKRMATLAITQVNNQAAAYAKYLENGTACSTFTVKSIKTARRQVLHNLQRFTKSEYAKIFQLLKDKVSSYFQVRHYVIHVETDPGNALFEATIHQNSTLEVKSITRLDTYHELSYCMMSRSGKMYCNCEQTLGGSSTISLSYNESGINTMTKT